MNNYNLKRENILLQVSELSTKFDTQILSNSLTKVFKSINQARVVQYLHFWLLQGYGVVINGERWIWKSLREWIEEALPDLGRTSLENAIRALIDLGIVIREKLNKEHRGHNYNPANRTFYYRLNYDRLEQVITEALPNPTEPKTDTDKSGSDRHKSKVARKQNTKVARKSKAKQNKLQYRQEDQDKEKEIYKEKESNFSKPEEEKAKGDPDQSSSTSTKESSFSPKPHLSQKANIPAPVLRDKTERVTNTEEQYKGINSMDELEVVRSYDSALGINPPEKQQPVQQRIRGIIRGDWLVNGKLDPEFLDWVANQWLKFGKKFTGMTIYEMRPIVTAAFRKTPELLADYWEGYLAETKHRVKTINTVLNTNLQNGYEIKLDKQDLEMLESRQRLIDPKDIAPFTPEKPVLDDNPHNPELTPKKNDPSGYQEKDRAGQDYDSKNRNYVCSSSIVPKSHPQQNSESIPVVEAEIVEEVPDRAPSDENGISKDAKAYQIYQAEQIENPIDPRELYRQARERLLNKTQFPEEAKREPEPQKIKISKADIENMHPTEINELLADPIERKYWSPILRSMSHFECELNAQGEVLYVDIAF